MNERQEAEWIYAKGLEIAILLKGSKKKEITADSVEKIIKNDYEEIAGKISSIIYNEAIKLISNEKTKDRWYPPQMFRKRFLIQYAFFFLIDADKRILLGCIPLKELHL